MANLTIRRIDPVVKDRPRRQAAAHGHSMEEEARRILSAGLSQETAQPENAFDWLREPFLGRFPIGWNRFAIHLAGKQPSLQSSSALLPAGRECVRSESALGLGDIELELPRRSPAGDAPDFDPPTD